MKGGSFCLIRSIRIRRISIHMEVKGKRKVFPVTGPVVAQRVGRDITLLFHDRGTRRG